MLRWLLVLMALAAFWTSSVHAVSMDGNASVSGLDVRTGSLVLPVSVPVTGRISGWLFRNVEDVPRPGVSGGAFSGGLVFRALRGPLLPVMPSAWMGLAVFGGLVVVIGAAAFWHRPTV